MHKSTKIFLIIAVLFIALIGGWYGLESYTYEHPKITIYFVTSEEDGARFTVPQIDFQERSHWGVTEEWDNRYFEAYEIIDQMIVFAKGHGDRKPYEFDSRVEIQGGKTIFIIEGTYTENGEQFTASETYSLDYIFTENIEEH